MAGAIAGRLSGHGGYGCLGNIVVGLLGSFIGGLIVSPFFKEDTTVGFFGSLGVAIVGALALILALRVLRRAL